MTFHNAGTLFGWVTFRALKTSPGQCHWKLQLVGHARIFDFASKTSYKKVSHVHQHVYFDDLQTRTFRISEARWWSKLKTSRAVIIYASKYPDFICLSVFLVPSKSMHLYCQNRELQIDMFVIPFVCRSTCWRTPCPWPTIPRRTCAWLSVDFSRISRCLLYSFFFRICYPLVLPLTWFLRPFVDYHKNRLCDAVDCVDFGFRVAPW